MLKEASHDGVLESREFEKWSKTNYNRILSWFDDVIDDETEKLKKPIYLNINCNAHNF